MAAKAKFEIRADDKTQKTFDRIKTNVKSVGVGLAGLGSVAAAAFLATGKSSIDAADQIQKLGIRLDASTEALSQYKHVADLSGVSFNTITTSWQRMNRRIAEAAKGSGEAKNALKELGLSAKELNKLRAEDKFEKIADALHRVENTADASRLAMKLFDTEGVALLQTMTAGAKGLREMRDAADEAGTTISQELADKAAEANDRLTQMQARLDGLKLNLAGPFADSVIYSTDLLDKFAKAIGLVEKTELEISTHNVDVYNSKIQLLEANIAATQERLEKSKNGDFFESVLGFTGGVSTDDLQKRLDGYKEKLHDVKLGAELVNQQLENIKSGKTEFGDEPEEDTAVLPPIVVTPERSKEKPKSARAKAIREEVDAVEEMLKQMERQATIVNLNESELKLWDLAMAGATQSQYELGQELVNTYDDLKRDMELREKHEEEVRKSAESMDRLAESVNAAADPYAEIIELQSNLNDLLEEGRINQEGYDLAMENSVEGLEEQEDRFADLESAIKGWSSTFADALVDGDTDFKGFVESFLKQIAKIAIAEASQPFFDGVGDFFGSIFSGAAGVEGRATGGPVSAGTPYIVGEKRPELFVPNQSGTIIPSLEGLGGGQVVNNTSITVHSDGSSSTQSDSIETAKQIESAVVGILMKQKRQGGLLA